MNDDEKELLKVGAETAMKPFADLISRLFGGAVEQYGGMWTDGLVARRKIRQIKLMGKLKHAIDAAGFEPGAIRDNIWVPAIQAALLEDDETLQDAWAALLANAADPRRHVPVTSVFPTILKDLSSREVKYLDALYDHAQSPGFHGETVESVYTEEELMGVYVKAGLSRLPKLSPLNFGEIAAGGEDLKADRMDFAFAHAMLIRLGLLRPMIETEPMDVTPLTRGPHSDPPRRLDVYVSMHYILTELAVKFIEACKSPA